MISHLRVFISSTMDLEAERDAVSDVISQLEQAPIRMEFFTARNQSPEEVCLTEVSKCDIYIGLFGKRYGFVPSEENPEKLSVVALEFEKARELKIPTLIFIQKGAVGRDSELERFLEQISNFKRGIFRRTFDTIDELKYWVLASLVYYLSNRTDDAEQRAKFEKLAPSESLFRRYVSKVCEFVDLKGIYQLRRVVQLRLEDIYVPLNLKPVSTLMDQALEMTADEIGDSSSVELTFPGPFPMIVRGHYGRVALPSERLDGTDRVVGEEELSHVVMRNKNIVVLGPPGCGKTTLLRHLAGNLVMDKESGLVPFLVPLREYARFLKNETDQSILHYLDYYFRSHGPPLPTQFVSRQLASGNCVVMLDGLDEILSERDRISAASNIEEFAACFGKDNVIIVSSRMSAYRMAQISNFGHFMIQKMTLPKMKEFMTKWFQMVEGVDQSEECKRVINQLASDVGLLSLSANPLMLSLICLAGLQGIPIPRKKGDLYDICVRTLLSSWEVKKGFQPKFNEPQKYDILKAIAFDFIEKRRVTATEYELRSFIEEKLESFQLSASQRMDVAAALLKHIIERSGLFIEREPNTYGFVHLGLRDYLAALYLAGIDDVKRMFDTCLLARLHNANYEQTIILTSRCLTNQSSERASILVNSVLNAKTAYEEYIHMDLILASKCLFESGISYGEVVREILHRISIILKSGSETERELTMRVFNEIDFELYDAFLSTLILDLDPQVSVGLVEMMSFGGMIPESCEFCERALMLLRNEALSDKASSRKASRAIGVWAARGSQKALSQAFEIIRKGGMIAGACAESVVPLAREDLNVRKELLGIVDENGSTSSKVDLLRYLMHVIPDEIKERANKISNDESERPELRKMAAMIYRYATATEAEVDSLRNQMGIKLIESMLRGKPYDRDPIELLVIEPPITEELAKKILTKIPEVYQANRKVTLRLAQVLRDFAKTSPSFIAEVKSFAQRSRESGTLANRRALAYVLAEIGPLQVEEEALFLVELVESTEEFNVARRAALNMLSNVLGWDEYSARLLKLSTDREVNRNLFSLLIRSKLDKKELLQAILGQIRIGDTEPIYYLHMLIEQGFE